MKHFITKKRTVAFFWLIAYVLLLVIPILGNAYILYSVNRAVNEETRSKYIYFLDGLSGKIDTNLIEINRAYKTVRENDSLCGVAYGIPDGMNPNYSLMQLARELGEMRYSFSKEIELNIYYPKLNVVLSADSYAKADDFAFDESKDSDEIMSLFRTDVPRVVKRTETSADGQAETVYRFFMPVVEGGRTLYVVCIGITEEELFGLNLTAEGDKILIFTGKKRLYLSSDSSVNTESLSRVLAEKEYSNIKECINGKICSVSYVKSKVMNYRYVYVNHNASVFSAAHRNTIVGVIVSVVCVLLMAIVFYKLYSWNFLSIKEILRDFENVDYDSESCENEFEVIRKKLAANLKQQSEMEHEIFSTEKEMKNKFLLDLLHGLGDDGTAMKNLKRFGIRFAGKYFCVTVISVKNTGVLMESEIANAYFVVENIMNDLFEGEDFSAAKDYNRLICIFSFNDGDNMQQHMRELFAELAELTEETMGIVFDSASSEQGVGTESIPRLYESAVRTHDLAQFYGMEEHVFSGDIETERRRSFNFTSEMESLLLNCINERDEKRFGSIIDEIFENMGITHPAMVIGMFYSIMNTIMRFIDSRAEQVIYEKIEQLDLLHEYGNIEKIKRFIKQYGKYVMDIMKSENEKKDKVFTKAIEYIDKHYDDCNLSVASVSDSIGVTSIYLAHIIKQNAGIKLSAYIAQLRVEKAKELLLSQPYIKIDDIARECGFFQSRTFSNTFKKYVGMTPSQFRASGGEMR